MAQINDNIRYATLPFTITANGVVGLTAVATVDICSAFNITCNTANLVMTLANPTILTAGLEVSVTNLPISTQAYIMYGNKVEIGETAIFRWTGTAWSVVGDVSKSVTVVLATIPAGVSVVTHNFGLPAGTFSNVEFVARDTVGSEVAIRRNVAGDTTNAVGISSPVAIATATTFRIWKI